MGHKIYNHYIQPNLPLKQNKQTTIKQNNQAFQHLLNDEIGKLKLTKHAAKRLQERNIQIDSSKWSTIQKKVSEAGEKGAKESLVLMSEATLVVNANNKTVITAMDRNEANAQIFTNINGAIVID